MNNTEGKIGGYLAFFLNDNKELRSKVISVELKDKFLKIFGDRMKENPVGITEEEITNFLEGTK